MNLKDHRKTFEVLFFAAVLLSACAHPPIPGVDGWGDHVYKDGETKANESNTTIKFQGARGLSGFIRENLEKENSWIVTAKWENAKPYLGVQRIEVDYSYYHPIGRRHRQFEKSNLTEKDIGKKKYVTLVFQTYKTKFQNRSAWKTYSVRTFEKEIQAHRDAEFFVVVVQSR